MLFDSIAYRAFQIVPWNIVRYNVFSGDERGPDIFGTEPWWFYALNLSLNFNISVIAAALSLPLAVTPILRILRLFKYQAFCKFFTEHNDNMRNRILLLSVYFWFVVFSIQPHKEERFIYVVYSLICLNAAQALDSSRKLLNKSLHLVGIDETTFISGLLVWTVILAHALLSLARILAQVRAYSAPMHILTSGLNGHSLICFGKDWYRFPSSFFIPNTSRTAFVKSEFNGLLPGKFNESETEGWRSGIWQLPLGMNDRNIEEPSHLVIVKQLSSHIRSRLENAIILLTPTFR